MSEEEIREIEHISYNVTQDDLLTIWMDLYHPKDHILTIFEPHKHSDFLRDINLNLDELHMFESFMLTIQVQDIEDAVWLCKQISHEEGPYVQLWSYGRLITDNIDK